MYQFVATNIDNIKKSIKQNTDYEIFGILSLKQMQDIGMIIAGIWMRAKEIEEDDF